MRARNRVGIETNIELKRVEFRRELSEVADRVYTNSSFVFYQDNDGFYYGADSAGVIPYYIGDIEAVNKNLEFFAEMEEA